MTKDHQKINIQKKMKNFFFLYEAHFDYNNNTL